MFMGQSIILRENSCGLNLWILGVCGVILGASVVISMWLDCPAKGEIA